MKPVLYVLMAALLLTSCTEQEDLTESEVLNAIKKFDEGWELKNIATIDSVLSPDYIYFTQTGRTFSRKNLVATAAGDSYSLDTMNRSEFMVTITGNTALVSTRWKGTGAYYDNPFTEDQRCSLVLVKRDNKVQILSEHCTPIRTGRSFH